MRIQRETNPLLYTLTLLALILIGQIPAFAQQDLAQQTYLIFQQNCLNCHGPHGSFTENLVIESAAGLINTGAVVPGKPMASELYTRLLENDFTKRMPLGQPQLSPEAIATIENWIQAGAPSWEVQHDVTFITTGAMLTAIQRHLATLDVFDRPFARYFTMTHLYNAGETPEALNAYKIALAKLVNSLSWGFEIINPQPIDVDETIFYIDLRDYEWDIRDAWTQIEAVYPYAIEFEATKRLVLFTRLTNLRQEMNCEVPYVYVDWFLATAVLPPLYHEILDLPKTDRELERDLEVDVFRNLQSAPGRRVWRAGFNDSGVSNHNRVVERHTSRHGAYWKSYDFAGSVGTQNIFTHPLSFQQDGGEVIFNLPNGLQAYYISDAAGNRIDVAPTEIVSNPAASDPAVHNGLSCIGCHTEGMKRFEDEVRPVIEQTLNPAYDKAHALRLYVDRPTMDRLLEEDTKRYEAALEKTGGVFGGIEPVHRFYETYHGPVNAPYAAASLGLQTDAFLSEIGKKSSLQGLGLTGLISGGNVKRDVWASQFSDVVSALHLPDVQAPVTPIRPPTQPLLGGTVYIPDTNLRAAIVETLSKAANDPITDEDMKGLTQLRADGRSIQDLTGLEYATNLQRLELRRNAISDLTPLAGLVRLNNIKLRDNVIADVSPLANLLSVDWMGLEENVITDLSPLRGLVKLNGIGISGNPVTDVSSLASLTSLERIDAWNTRISDFSSLAKLPKLEWIEMGNEASISTLPSFKGLKSLQRLELNNCSIRDLSPLKEFTQLEWLELVNNAISDISPLRSLKNLKTLNLDDNIISDVSPLAELTGLEVLYLENNVISDVSPLARLKNLQRLDVRNNAIFDLSPLDELPINRLSLRMSGNPGFTGRGKITGPWLWMIVPTGNSGGAAAARSGVDFLSFASGGKVTELKVATNGATEGNPVGDKVWVVGELSATGGDNLNDMANTTGLGTGNISNHVAYGSLTLEAPREQKTEMLAGSDDAVKVWLNGELVHNNPVDRGSNDYQERFPVTLKQGRNVLLIAVYERTGGWSGFFGFPRSTEYTVLPPGTGPDDSTTPTFPTWDINEDGQTDITDLLIVVSDLNKETPVNPRSDVNGDGVVDGKDIAIVAAHINEKNEPAAPSMFTLPSEVTFKVVQDALDLLRAVDDGSLTFQRGITKLKQLLALFVPEETALLHNYPNPFNPETWVPYQLSESADVTVRIYTARGMLVRTLEVGHQPAGIYQHRSRAVYWDGKNEVGESVASGIYFYSLTAGNFTATRKMIIRK